MQIGQYFKTLIEYEWSVSFERRGEKITFRYSLKYIDHIENIDGSDLKPYLPSTTKIKHAAFSWIHSFLLAVSPAVTLANTHIQTDPANFST